MEENQQNTNKRLWLKIIVPIIIVVIIGGLWFYKNSPKTSDNVTSTTTQSETTENATPGIALVTGYFPLDVKEEIDLEELKSFGLPIIMDFGADSCAPCKLMAPVLKKLNTELAGKAIIRFVDVWKNPGLASNFPVQVIPTQIFIDAEGNPYVPSDNVTLQYIQYNYQDSGEHAFTAHQGGLTEEQMLEALKEMGLKE